MSDQYLNTLAHNFHISEIQVEETLRKLKETKEKLKKLREQREILRETIHIHMKNLNITSYTAEFESQKHMFIINNSWSSWLKSAII